MAHPVLVISGQDLPLNFNSGGSAFQATFAVIGSSAADIENFDAGPVSTDPFEINWELTEGDEALIRCEVQATPDGCSKFFYLRVLRLVDIADILTPNDDGTNDTWTLDINDSFDDLNFVLSIYGRNGARIVDKVSFEGEYTWDGAGCPDGVYFYVLESGDNAGDVILPTLRGAITLLRN